MSTRYTHSGKKRLGSLSGRTVYPTMITSPSSLAYDHSSSEHPLRLRDTLHQAPLGCRSSKFPTKRAYLSRNCFWNGSELPLASINVYIWTKVTKPLTTPLHEETKPRPCKKRPGDGKSLFPKLKRYTFPLPSRRRLIVQKY